MTTSMDMQTDESAIEEQLKALGNRVAVTRRSAKMSLEDLRDATGVSVATIQRIEDGNGGVGSRNLLAVMNRLSISPADGFSLALDQESLPAHTRHLDDEDVKEAIEDAARAACDRLGELFPGARAEVDGISSNFQGMLVEHLSAMLCGQPAYRPSHHVPLKELVYSDAMLGREYSLKDGAHGFLVRLIGTNKFLEYGRFRRVQRAADMYTSWEAAAAAVRQYVKWSGDHLPGPVRIVSGWWSEGETGARFTPPGGEAD